MNFKSILPEIAHSLSLSSHLLFNSVERWDIIPWNLVERKIFFWNPLHLPSVPDPLLRSGKFQRFFEPRPKLTENDTESHHQFRWITTNPVKKRMTHTHCDKSSVEGENLNIFINKANHAPQMTTTYRPSPALQLIRITHLRILHWPTPSIVCVGKVYQLCRILSQTWFNLFILSTNNTSLIAPGRYCSLIWPSF